MLMYCNINRKASGKQIESNPVAAIDTPIKVATAGIQVEHTPMASYRLCTYQSSVFIWCALETNHAAKC